jgi:thiamine kinase-like enzyme
MGFHSDVRTQNMLAREDNSVVIIDFERSSLDKVRPRQIALEIGEVEDCWTISEAPMPVQGKMYDPTVTS